MNNSIVFVSPCHHRPLGINSLDELDVEFRKDESDPQDAGAWWIKDQCCGDCHNDEASARKALDRYKVSVFRASVRHAREELARKIEAMQEDLGREIEQFSDWHDPTVERVYVAAIWGKDGNRGIANYRTSECDTPEEALQNINTKSVFLTVNGYVEAENDETVNQGMKLIRKFVKGDSVRYVGYWSEPIRTGSGYGSTETEGAYLCTA